MQETLISPTQPVKLVYIDTETTGTDFNDCAIWQLAGAVVIDGELKEEFDIRMQPHSGARLDQQALTVGNVTREQLAMYQQPVDGYLEFAAILGKYIDKFKPTDKAWFVGYNSQFDAQFVRALFERCGDKFFGSFFWWPVLDVSQFAAMLLFQQRSTLANFKLGTVCEALKIKHEAPLHDASTDILLTRKVFELYVQRFGLKLDGKVVAA